MDRPSPPRSGVSASFLGRTLGVLRRGRCPAVGFDSLRPIDPAKLSSGSSSGSFHRRGLPVVRPLPRLSSGHPVLNRCRRSGVVAPSLLPQLTPTFAPSSSTIILFAIYFCRHHYKLSFAAGLYPSLEASCDDISTSVTRTQPPAQSSIRRPQQQTRRIAT
jgi:hypothetical protein